MAEQPDKWRAEWTAERTVKRADDPGGGVNEEAIFPKAPAAGGEAGRRHKNQKRNAKRMIKYWYLRTKTFTMVLLVSLL